MLIIASLLSGLVFGAGLLISGMIKPTKVLAFLDIFGAWDPSLAVVMVAALAVSAPGFMLATGRSRPLLAAQSVWPTKNHIDRPQVPDSSISDLQLFHRYRRTPCSQLRGSIDRTRINRVIWVALADIGPLRNTGLCPSPWTTT
jgi:hypothetical protein